MELIGRDEDIARLRQASGSFVVWGPAGVGKTSLVRAAFPDAPFCALVRARSESEALEAIALGLGIEQHDAPSLARAAGRHEEIVLDACDSVAGILAVFESWDTRLVLTARSTEGISLSPFELAPLDPDAAVSLWQACCVQQGVPSDRILAGAIVERLDRLPQAIVWLAGRAALLGEEECLARLDQRAIEQTPLVAALEESLDALDEATLGALEGLVAFEDGAPATLVEDVASLEHVEVLRRRSLVHLDRRRGMRVCPYRAVVTAMRLRMKPERWDAVTNRHAELVLQRTTKASPASIRGERFELEAIARRDLGGELETQALLHLTRVALDDGTASKLREPLERYIGGPLDSEVRLALAKLDRRAGRFESARRWLPERGFEALLELAHLDRQQSRLDAALECYEAALEAAGNEAQECRALGELGRMLQSLGRLAEAQEKHAGAIARAKKLGLEHREALERSLHARATHRRGHVREAVGLHEKALALHEGLGDARLVAAEKGHLGFCHHELGDLARAEALLRAAVEGLADVGDVVLEQIDRVLLARVLLDMGRLSEARLELHIAQELAASLDMPRAWLTWHFVAGLVALAEGDDEGAKASFREAAEQGALFEVGFETQLHAYLAYLGDDVASNREVVDALEAPGPTLAWQMLMAAAEGRAIPEVLDAIGSTSSDVRRVRALIGTQQVLVVADDGRGFELGETKTDLSRRSAPRRLLVALADARISSPGVAVGRDALIEAGWPGEKMRADAADKRLRTAIWTLRKEGLDEVLLTRDEGYLLDPNVPFRRS